MERRGIFNFPDGVELDREEQKLLRAVHAFNRKILPDAAKEKPVPMRRVGRELVSRRAERQPIKRGILFFHGRTA